MYVGAYGGAFYSARREMTLRSARRVLSIVRRHVQFESVADFGCGSGTWLSAALEMGATRAVGFEGEWMKPEMLDDSRIDFRPHNLEQPVAGLSTDLAISLEVAEHLSFDRAESFVDDLCAVAPVILFGAAIPGQGGIGHVNEQWQSYWAAKFEKRGYRVYDAIRPLVWTDDSLPYWYRQNCLLYSKAPLDAAEPTMLDLVHPAKWEEELRIPLKKRIRQAAGSTVRRLLSR